MAVFIHHRPKGIHQFSSLVDKAFSNSEQYPPGLLFFSFRLDKAHLRALCCNHDCFRVHRIILLPLYEGLHILWSD